MPLDPQAKILLDQLAALGGGAMHQGSPQEARQMFDAFAAMAGPGEPVAHVEDRTIPGPNGDIPVRIYRPAGEGPLPVIVYFHGGGWVIGGIHTHDVTSRELANSTGAIVISVDYRLAPEHRFPVPMEDAYAATVWAAENAGEIGGDASRLAVAGDSAGGNLAAATALAARDRGGPALTFQLLIYPVTDLTMSHPSYVENAEGYLLTAESMKWFIGHYLGPDGDPRDPLASPLHADDLSGLPPALVITGEFDPLRDEGEAYGAKLREAGVDATVSRYDGQIHGFFGMRSLFEAAGKALDECSRCLKEALSPA